MHSGNKLVRFQNKSPGRDAPDLFQRHERMPQVIEQAGAEHVIECTDQVGADVVCVEPGLIRTEFGSTAAGSVSSGDGDPYASFNEAVAKSTREVYDGPLSRLGGDADDVARAIERALLRRRSPTRVPVTASARVLMGLHSVLPDRAWDRVVGSAFRG